MKNCPLSFLADIETATCPAGQMQIEARQDRVQQRVAQSGDSAEEARQLPGNIGQRVLGCLQLARYPPWAEQREIMQMPLAVVLSAIAP